MDSPLVISFIIFIAAVGVGLWSQYCLPRLSDSLNILFIICFFLGIGSAASCLFHLLYLLLVGQSAQGDIAAFGTLITIAALWKPLNYVTDAANKRKGKRKEPIPSGLFHWPFWIWAVLDTIRKYFERPSGRPGGRA